MSAEIRLTERALSVRLPAGLHEAVREYAYQHRISIGEATRVALTNLVGWAPEVSDSRRASAARKR